MPNQENLFQYPEYEVPEERLKNTDPREQSTSAPHDPGYRPYDQGYVAQGEHEIWQGENWQDEGQKVRPESTFQPFRVQQGVPLVAFVALLLIVFELGHVIGPAFSWIGITVLVATAIIVAIANWKSVTIALPERSFDIQEHAQLILTNKPGGRVTVRRGVAGQIGVRAEKHLMGFRIDPERVQTRFEQTGDTVRITTDYNWNSFLFSIGQMRYEITLPPEADLQIDNGSGRLSVEEIKGKLRLQTGSGGIEGRALQGQMYLKTGSGGIKLDQLDGQIEVLTGSGGIEGYSLRGSTRLKTGSGGVRLGQSQLSGSSNITTGSGGIHINQSQLSGSCYVKTGSGGIEYDGELDLQAQVDFRTGSGGINMLLPANAAFTLDAHTGSGGVHNAFGGNIVSNEPHALLRLRTGSGGIRIAKI
jgi:hypothetical protein